METEPLERIDEHQSGETPEDVAILYSWANLQGAKYRDFSANRREYRAQMRHRAAEQLRLMELRAQSEAEAAAAHADAEAAAAHAEADAATVKLAASRSMHSTAPEELLKEKEVEEVRRTSLREAAQQARRAAAERLEAARRSEAAALADSIARREEREIAEAQASALRQAAQYHESEVRSRQMMAQHPPSEDQVPGQITDPYSPQILPEGEYYDGPGTPPSELEAGRFRTQREYIERSTGTELPSFKMPPLFNEDHFETERAPVDRHLQKYAAAPRTERAEVVERIPEGLEATGRQSNERPPKRREQAGRAAERSPRSSGAYDGSLLNRAGEAASEPRARFAADAERADRGIDPETEEWRPRRSAGPPEVREAQRFHEEHEEQHGAENDVLPLYPATPRPSGSWLRQISARGDEGYGQREATRLPIQEYRAERKTEHVADRKTELMAELKTDRMAERKTERKTEPMVDRKTERMVEHKPGRPSVEATYNDGQRSESATQFDRQASGFRPPWLTQAQAPRQSGSRPAQAPTPAPERSAPRWLYPEQTPEQAPEQAPEQVSEQALMPMPDAPQPASVPRAGQGVRPAEAYGAGPGHAAQATQENVASRWFALKKVFAKAEAAQNPERPSSSEKSSTPMIAVYSLAGGVGKTSLVATLGRTLSSLGEKVLLTDTTSQGLLPYYFGANQLVPGAARTFSPPPGSTDAPIHMVSYDLNQRALDGQAQGALVDDLLIGSRQVNRVLIDLNGSCGWLIERIARFKPTVMVPIVADMNSVVSIESLEKKFGAMRSTDGEPLRPVYLLNQFDASLPLHIDLREVLRQQLGDRLLPFVIRRVAGISEALAEGMTIVDYDPDSPAAQDFLGLANWVRAVSVMAPIGAAAGFRNLRWSER